MTKHSFVARFTPSLLSGEMLEAIFVKREKLAARLVELMRESALSDNKHYVLLVGPRGIGKTHLVSLVYHRVQREPNVADRLLVAWLREEEWGISSFLDLLLRILRSLHEEYDDKELAGQCERLPTLSAAQAEREAENLLKATVGQKTLLVIAENVDEIFNGLGDQGQQQLRAYIQNNAFFTILATSQSLFRGVSLRTSPFYGFFETHHLQELSFEDAVSLVANIAKHRGDEGLASMIRTPRGRARIRAVHHLAGGNPRVYVIFSQLLTMESLDQLVDPVLETLDDLTPYYQARMSYVSPQQRKLVDFLCHRRGAVPVAEIAQENFLTSQTTSSQLRKLQELGYVQSHQRGRESYYELREPLMRLTLEVKRTRGEPVRLLVEFLRLWYSREELAVQLDALPLESVRPRDYLLNAIRAGEADPLGPAAKACWEDLVDSIESDDWEQACSIAAELGALIGAPIHEVFIALGPAPAPGADEPPRGFLSVFHSVWYQHVWLFHVIRLPPLKSGEPPLRFLDVLLEVAPKDGRVFRDLWCFRLMVALAAGRYEEVVRSCDALLEVLPHDATLWTARVMILWRLRRHQDALESLHKLEEADPHRFVFRRSVVRAGILMESGSWEEGVRSLDAALEACHGDAEPDWWAIELALASLLMHTHNETVWREHVTVWIALFRKHKWLEVLGKAVLATVSYCLHGFTGPAPWAAWGNVWQELGGACEKMAVPLRLLRTAVEYRTSRDDRILLALPTEEREFLELMLETPPQE
jgi:tetratricopeptide (TPR) repeat protein